MAGIFKSITNYVLGGGEDTSLKPLLDKINAYECENARLQVKEPSTGALISIYHDSKVSLSFDQKSNRFFLVVENLAPEADDDEIQIKLPITAKMIWRIEEPVGDDDDFKLKHIFDFSKESKSKTGVIGKSTYVLEFTEQANVKQADILEDYINDILDVVEKQEAEESKEDAEKENTPSKNKINFDDALFEAQGQFFVYNKEADRNDVIEENVIFLVRKLSEDFEYAFTVVTHDTQEMVINTKVHGKTQVSINNSSGVIMWIHDTFKESDEELDAYLFYFTETSPTKIAELSNVVSKCIFECQRGISYEDYIKEEDQQYMVDAYIEDAMDEEMSEYNEEDDDMYEGLEDSNYPDHFHEDQEYENADMTQAHGYDRTFISRGNGVGVYGTSEDGTNTFYGDIPILKEYGGDPAKNLMLHENENKLLFIDPSQKHQIQCFDFEKEKVVETWEAQGVKEFNSFYNQHKNAQSTPDSNVIACSNKGLYTLDPRINKKEKNAQQKVYSTNYLFSRISANLDGNIAVGSKNGEIRMYTKMGQNAKTMLPGMGDNITGLDVSKDGAWILATTAQYILLIPTRTNSGKTGFETRMGKQKQIPRKLKLVHSDIVKYDLHDKNFTKATFNNGGNITESFITASIGSFIVIWKLKKVSKGNLGSYDIKKLHHSVVSTESKFNTENEILVTMPRCFTTENRAVKG